MNSLQSLSLATFATALLLGSQAAHAIITGINTSTGFVQFDDTSSFNPSAFPGITNTTINAPGGWVGAPFGFPLATIDPVTADSAIGSIDASFAPIFYAVNLLGVILVQPAGNTGFALMRYQFSVDFQTDALGLPSLPTLAPTFFINGTVAGSGFASLVGRIQYSGSTLGPIEGVTYNYLNPGPGPINFATTVVGTATFGTTPLLPANEVLTLFGDFLFTVDPASISASSTMEAVPEPAAGLLALLSLPFFLSRRRARA